MTSSQKYLLLRVGSAVLTIFLLVSATFFLIRLVPGSPFDDGALMPESTKRQLEANYGLDKPLLIQYSYWIEDFFKGDLHNSMQYPELRVTEILFPATMVSIKIGTLSLALALISGIFLGVISTWSELKNIGILRDLFHLLILACMSLPVYLIGTLFILYFSFRLNWLPPAFLEDRWSYLLPVFALSMKPGALFARYLRASLLEVLSQDYIRTARAKGLRPIKIILKHALKNSAIPIIAIIGPVAAQLLTGSVVIESLFQLPGLGKHFVEAVLNRDYTLVVGATLILGVVLTFTNLAADVLLVAVDPRIDLNARKSQ